MLTYAKASDVAMPRGLLPTGTCGTVLRVVVSMTETASLPACTTYSFPAGVIATSSGMLIGRSTTSRAKRCWRRFSPFCTSTTETTGKTVESKSSDRLVVFVRVCGRYARVPATAIACDRLLSGPVEITFMTASVVVSMTLIRPVRKCVTYSRFPSSASPRGYSSVAIVVI